MLRTIFIIFGIGACFLLNDLKKRVEDLEKNNLQLEERVSAESQATMDFECELESDIESVAIQAGRAIGDLDTELRTLQLDFYKFLSVYQHWNPESCKFENLAPYINETLTPEALKSLENCLRERGLKFTVNEQY